MTDKGTATAPPAESAKDTKLRAAYTAANSRLRKEQQDRFNVLYAEEAKARGVKWSPKLTPEQKDRAAFEALVRDHPEWVNGQPPSDQPPQPASPEA